MDSSLGKVMIAKFVVNLCMRLANAWLRPRSLDVMCSASCKNVSLIVILILIIGSKDAI